MVSRNRFFPSLILLAFGLNATVTAQHRVSASGSGSHRHMHNKPHDHQHYIPTPPVRSAPGVPPKTASILEEKELLHDSKHLREELGEIFTEEHMAKMSSEEIEFHYFKVHDFDDNNKLDGLEMLNAITHILPHDEILDLRKKGEQNLSVPEKMALEKQQSIRDEQMNHFVDMIDAMIDSADKDKDGFINYMEYSSANMKK